jgi:tripartite-type tricarboxylate transporter receptor subunit TctC
MSVCSTSRRSVVRRSLLRWIGASPLASFPFGLAHAQEFPARPLRVIIPFPAGGPTDAIARLAAEGLTAKLGQPVTPINRAGAAGNVASDFVAREPADGYTLLVAGQGQMFINQALGRKLGHDPDKDFTYVGMLAAFPNVLVVNPDVIPAKTMAEFIRMAKEQPGKLSYGSNGVGSLSHLTTEVIAKEAGAQFLHVPYQGAAPQMADLLSGRIGFTIVGPQSVVPHIKEGKLRALAVSTAARFPGLPEVPTLMESGFPKLDVPVWFGVYVHSATPAPVLAKLRTALDAVVGTPEYQSGLAKVSAQPLKVPVESAGARFAHEKKMWSDAVEATGAKEN